MARAGHRTSSASLLVTLLVVVAAPFGAGLAVRQAAAGFGHLGPRILAAARLVGLAALLLLLFEVASQVRVGGSILAGLGLLATFLLGELLLAVGLTRGLPEPQRLALLLPLTMRDFAVAAGIAQAAFGARATGLLGAYGLLVLIVGGILARGGGRRLLGALSWPPGSSDPGRS
jgi:hypothetical protein